MHTENSVHFFFFTPNQININISLVEGLPVFSQAFYSS